MNKFITAINTCLIIFSSISLHAALINLTERDMYVRQGFDVKWITSLPDEKNRAWQKFPANKDNRSVRVRQLEFKGLPEFKHFSLKKYADMTFTYVTSFNLKKQNIQSGLLGLHLAQIGLNWEVYINGNLIKSQMYISKDGSIDIERAVRGAVIGINPFFLKSGINILAFKIVGDPVDNRTGLFMKKGYYIGKLESIKSFNDHLFKMMLIAVYIFFGLYHLFLYIIRRKELYNLFYSAFSIAVAVFLFCKNELVFSIFTDTLLIKNVELVALAFTTPPIIFLLELLGRKRITIVGKIHFIIMTIISILIVFVWKESLLRLVQLLGMLGFLYAIIYSLVLPFVKRVLKNYNALINTNKSKRKFLIPRAT